LLCFVFELDWYMSPGSESFQRTQSVWLMSVEYFFVA
jgi:hypothetical protein